MQKFPSAGGDFSPIFILPFLGSAKRLRPLFASGKKRGESGRGYSLLVNHAEIWAQMCEGEKGRLAKQKSMAKKEK